MARAGWDVAARRRDQRPVRGHVAARRTRRHPADRRELRAVVEVPAFAAFATAADAEVLEVLPAEAATMDLSEASFIVGAGAGLGSPEAFARWKRWPPVSTRRSGRRGS